MGYLLKHRRCFLHIQGTDTIANATTNSVVVVVVVVVFSYLYHFLVVNIFFVTQVGFPLNFYSVLLRI